MTKSNVRKFKWFWAWQDEAEEAWLREMSNKGWHLSSVGIPTIYDFESGEPEDFVYSLDYRSHFKMDKEDYLQLFRDAGWEYIGEMSGWQYFRKQAQPGEGLEIYTDAESKISKYQRLLTFAAILMLPLFIFVIVNTGDAPYGWISVIRVINFLLFVLYLYAVVKILIRINQLKKL
jgi:hypothetical protein